MDRAQGGVYAGHGRGGDLAGAGLAQTAESDLAQLGLPDVIPHAAPPADWRTPPSLAALTTQARAKLNAMAARKTRPPKQTARPLAQLRAW